jgi:hypothetical protein
MTIHFVTVSGNKLNFIYDLGLVVKLLKILVLNTNTIRAHSLCFFTVRTVVRVRGEGVLST